MAGGMPRKPAALRQLEGNRGHRPIPKEVRAHGTPQMPVGLKPDEEIIWLHLVEVIPKVVLKTCDEQVIERMAIHWAAFRGLCEQIRKLPPNGYLVAGSTGSPIPNPLFRMRAMESAAMDRCGEKLGLSPIARTKLVEPDKDEEDPLAQLLAMAANDGEN